MEKFIQHLKDVTSDSSGLYSCFAINTKLVVGMKIGLTSEQIRNFLTNCLQYLCDEKFSKMQLGAYPVATPKEFIETIKSTDGRISSTLERLLSIPISAETNATALSKYNAYMLIVDGASDSKVYFFTKTNPFIAYKKNNFFFALFNNAYDPITDNIVRLTKHFDCILLDDKCYITTVNGRSLLGLNAAAKDASLKNKARLIQDGVISQEDAPVIDSYVNKHGKATCLSEVDEVLMQTLSHITDDNKDVLSTKYRLSIRTDSDGKHCIDVSNEEKLEVFIATLTNKRGKNFDDETVETKSPFVKR